MKIRELIELLQEQESKGIEEVALYPYDAEYGSEVVLEFSAMTTEYVKSTLSESYESNPYMKRRFSSLDVYLHRQDMYEQNDNILLLIQD